jgi:hypothetical protein
VRATCGCQASVRVGAWELGGGLDVQVDPGIGVERVDLAQDVAQRGDRLPTPIVPAIDHALEGERVELVRTHGGDVPVDSSEPHHVPVMEQDDLIVQQQDDVHLRCIAPANSVEDRAQAVRRMLRDESPVGQPESSWRAAVRRGPVGLAEEDPTERVEQDG